MYNEECLFRAAYEWPANSRTPNKRGRITFVTTRQDALPFAAGFVKYMCKGYLLSIVETRPAEINRELELQ